MSFPLRRATSQSSDTPATAHGPTDICWSPSLATKSPARISFYYDASCPWCLITSRWLTEAIHEDTGIDRGELFTQFGKSYFIDPKLDDENFTAAVLERMDLPSSYLHELDNTDRDVQLQQHLDDAIAVAGDDVGVPLIVFETESGERVGYFGPVIARMPDPERGLEIWDSLYTIATGPDFFELKRPCLLYTSPSPRDS